MENVTRSRIIVELHAIIYPLALMGRITHLIFFFSFIFLACVSHYANTFTSSCLKVCSADMEQIPGNVSHPDFLSVHSFPRTPVLKVDCFHEDILKWIHSKVSYVASNDRSSICSSSHAPSIHPPTYLSIHPPIRPSIHPSTHLPTYLPIHAPTHPSANPASHSFIHLSINPANQPSIYSLIHPSICQSIQLPVYLTELNHLIRPSSLISFHFIHLFFHTHLHTTISTVQPHKITYPIVYYCVLFVLII